MILHEWKKRVEVIALGQEKYKVVTKKSGEILGVIQKNKAPVFSSWLILLPKDKKMVPWLAEGISIEQCLKNILILSYGTPYHIWACCGNSNDANSYVFEEENRWREILMGLEQTVTSEGLINQRAMKGELPANSLVTFLSDLCYGLAKETLNLEFYILESIFQHAFAMSPLYDWNISSLEKKLNQNTWRSYLDSYKKKKQ